MQVVPHITDAIQEWIERVARIPVDGEEGPADVCVIELGGTIGSSLFLMCVSISCIPFLLLFLKELNLMQGTLNLCHLSRHLASSLIT